MDKETFVAIISVARSGSTIVASAVNSLPNSFIFGEPWGGVDVKLPDWAKALPVVIDTKFGMFHLHRQADIMDQIIAYARAHGCTTYGFKECRTPNVDAVQKVMEYIDRIDKLLIVMRDPRKVYGSMMALGGPGPGILPPPEMISGFYTDVAALSSMPQASVILLEEFRKDPVAELRRAMDIDEHITEISFDIFAGGGDPQAKAAKKVYRLDRRRPYWGAGIESAIEAYDAAVALRAAERVA